MHYFEKLERAAGEGRLVTIALEPADRARATLARLNQRFPGVRLEQKYGTTETGSPRSASRDNNSLWLRLSDPAVETHLTGGRKLRQQGLLHEGVREPVVTGPVELLDDPRLQRLFELLQQLVVADMDPNRR